jgi:hypothetical protein
MSVNYEQFCAMQVKQMETLLEKIQAGKVFYCITCECWCGIEDKREDALGTWPICDECRDECGVDPDNVGDAAMLDSGDGTVQP